MLTYMLLELLAAPDQAQEQYLAHQRALLPSAEVHRGTRRGGSAAGQITDGRRTHGAQPEATAPQGLGERQGLDHARGGPRQVHPARRPARDLAWHGRSEAGGAHGERRLLGRWRGRQRQEPARADPHANS